MLFPPHKAEHITGEICGGDGRMHSWAAEPRQGPIPHSGILPSIRMVAVLGTPIR